MVLRLAQRAVPPVPETEEIGECVVGRAAPDPPNRDEPRRSFRNSCDAASLYRGNEPGSLGALTSIIGKHQGNITNLKITNRSQDFFEILVDIEVEDVKHLTNIIAALRAAPSINSVERARG